MLNIFPNIIIIPAFTGDVKTDVENLLNENGKQKTFDHAKAVAEMNVKIAEQYGLDKTICELGGYLHDICAIIAPADMLSYAIDNGWYVDEVERKYPMLIHQRISKVIAKEDFSISDERILSAVEHHSTLNNNPSDYDMALLVADKLAWDGEGEAPFYSVVSNALKQSLEAASLAYMDYIVDHKMILYPHKWFEDGAKYLRNKLGGAE
jgi:putative nucleotidyltransferase with HDIG domain